MFSMANPVQDKVKIDWQQVQSEGGQRLSRIGRIFKAASSEAFDEFKAGTDEIQTISRKSLAEMIAQLKEAEAHEAKADSIVLESEVESDATDLVVADETEAAEIPTWRQLFTDFWHIANDRKGEWTQDLLARLQIQMDKFDTHMVEEYGERYAPFRRLVRVIRFLVDTAYNRVSKAEKDSKPVSVEILDQDADNAEAPQGAQG
jgi:c-di-AMP phosphodiesterase-like protein